MSDDDDDVPRLSAHTLAALREFYEESSAPLRDPPGDPGGAGAAVEEDWVRLTLNPRDLGGAGIKEKLVCV